MADYWLAGFAGFLAGLLTGWVSLIVLSACTVSGRISEMERASQPNDNNELSFGNGTEADNELSFGNGTEADNAD